jgi:hypothetical protein
MRFQTAALLGIALALAAPAAAQSSAAGQYYQARTARRHFVSISYDWVNVQSYSFGRHPLGDLLGQPVSEVHLQPYQYETKDGQTRVTVGEFSHRAQGFGVTVYPFGSSSGPTLAVRGSVEQLPTIRLAFDGPAPAAAYALTNGRAYDASVGVDVADRSPGWGLGSHAFLLGGVGRARSDQVRGTRYFAEGGGGLAVGPVGVDLSFKFVVNRFTEPVAHQVFNIPISVRGTLTF